MVGACGKDRPAPGLCALSAAGRASCVGLRTPVSSVSRGVPVVLFAFVGSSGSLVAGGSSLRVVDGRCCFVHERALCGVVEVTDMHVFYIAIVLCWLNDFLICADLPLRGYPRTNAFPPMKSTITPGFVLERLCPPCLRGYSCFHAFPPVFRVAYILYR